MKNIHREIIKEPYFFCHRDLHTRNIMVSRKKIYFIDFQDTMKGPALYDLCSLLEDPYFSYDQNIKKEMVNFFYKKQKKLNIFNSKADLEQSYSRVTQQRLLKALGTYCGQFYIRKNSRYLIYIGATIEKLRRHLGEKSVIRMILKERYYGQ